jgi:DNA-binding transcriptional regulator YdaS (Cro superfamily)
MERIIFDYSKLRGRIIEKCGTQKSFAGRLGVGEATLVQKMKCKVYFTQGEILKAADILEIRPESLCNYFFTQRVHKCEQ